MVVGVVILAGHTYHRCLYSDAIPVTFMDHECDDVTSLQGPQWIKQHQVHSSRLKGNAAMGWNLQVLYG